MSFWKWLRYHITLTYNVLRNCVDGKWHWWNKLDPYPIWIGAMPLRNRGDVNNLLQVGIGAIVTIVEPYELYTKGFLSSPVQPQEWQEAKIDQLIVAVSDFTPPSSTQVQEALEFIHSHVQAGKQIYIHCKAGRGRSAFIAVCYFMAYEKMSLAQAIEHIKKYRPKISLNASQMHALRQIDELD